MPKKNEIVVTGPAVTYKIPSPAGEVKLETFVPYTLIKRGVKREIITPFDAPEQFQQEAVAAREKRKESKDTALVKALGLAHYWQSLLDSGKFKTLTEIAITEGTHVTQVRRLMRLILLAPTVIEMLMSNNQRHTLNLEFFMRKIMPAKWQEQESMLLK
ncbi:MAG: hypothetical protein IT497_07030 [Ottowia sp.]|nr:hypothetical protein [Ottowia sp.]